MSYSIYSWFGTALHILLDDEIAAAFNRAQDAFQLAQVVYKNTHGIPWTGTEQIYINWTDEEMHAWNGIADVVNATIKLNGGKLDLREEDMTSKYLVKV